MKLRTALIPLVLTLISLSSAQAQGAGQSGNEDRRMQAMFKDITLAATQKTQIDSIMTKFRAEMGPMTPGAQPDSAAMAHRRDVMQQRTAALRLVLTKDQQVTFDKNIEEMRAARRPPGSR
ncbi:MAG: hypothetical protein ABI679_00700 [Gemmatimonadota bacterium]